MGDDCRGEEEEGLSLENLSSVLRDEIQPKLGMRGERRDMHRLMMPFTYHVRYALRYVQVSEGIGNSPHSRRRVRLVIPSASELAGDWRKLQSQ